MFERFTRPIESYNKIWLGSIALAVIGTVLAGVVLFGNLKVGKTRYHAEFAQAAALKKGNQVTIAGIQVGTVDGVKLAGDHVVVDFSVRSDVHLGKDTAAAIKLTTILGSRYFELRPAGNNALENATIPLANTEVPYDLQATLAGATSTFDSIDAERVVESVKTLNRDLRDLPGVVPQALENLHSLATVISDRRGQLSTLLANADVLTRMLRDQKADLGALVLQGRDLLAEIATRRAAVQRLFASASQLVDRARTILGDEPAINQLMANTQEFSRMMVDHDALLRNVMQSMPLAVRNFANISGSGNAIDVNAAAGPFVDSWMCALSGRAKQLNLVEYFKDCE
ncbi:MCE family protein [Mycobacterium vicinigordonae]|uniref:MCE family protein n=1 Tax=Mycobacterium vicinigordonae TaxID=1719132 RepID=A0A7D6IQG8_9MYCO|nr:MCE family protein [Mycobacterium vicinigordonae]QLL06499.1 MCE family protein [Mycobacterium vicinigordonae]